MLVHKSSTIERYDNENTRYSSIGGTKYKNL